MSTIFGGSTGNSKNTMSNMLVMHDCWEHGNIKIAAFWFFPVNAMVGSVVYGQPISKGKYTGFRSIKAKDA